MKRLKAYTEWAVIRTPPDGAGDAYIADDGESPAITPVKEWALRKLEMIRRQATPAENRRMGTLRLAHLRTAEILSRRKATKKHKRS